MGSAGWVNDQGLGVTDIGEVGKEVQTVDEGNPCLSSALNFERKYSTGAFGVQLARKRVIRMAGKIWMSHSGYGVMVVEKLDHCAGIGDMLFHAHTKRFHTLKYVEGAGRALAGSKISQSFLSSARDKRSRAKLLGEHKIVKALIGLRKLREFT
jgi:hypothetical protein